MEKCHRDALRLTYIRLLAQLDVAVVDHLYQKRIFEEEHKDIISSKATPQDKRRKIYEILITRGPDAYTIFMNILPLLGQDYLREEIEANCAKVQIEVAEASPDGEREMTSEPVASERERDVATQHERNVAPERERDVAPQRGRDVAPQCEKDVAPERERDVAYKLDDPGRKQYDFVVIRSKKDAGSCNTFIQELNDESTDGCCHDDNFGSLYDQLPSIYSRATFILLYLTHNFTRDETLIMVKNEIVTQWLKDPVKKKFLVPVWATSESDMRDDDFFNKCFGLTNLFGIDPEDSYDVNKLKKHLISQQYKKLERTEKMREELVNSMSSLSLSPPPGGATAANSSDDSATNIHFHFHKGALDRTSPAPHRGANQSEWEKEQFFGESDEDSFTGAES